MIEFDWNKYDYNWVYSADAICRNPSLSSLNDPLFLFKCAK